MLKHFKEDQLIWVRMAAFLAFIIPMAMMPSLWLSFRGFPMVPFFDGIPLPNVAADVFLIVVFALLFVIFVFKPKWQFGVPLVFIYVFWVVMDQNRIQPFYFEIIFMVLALTYFKDHPNQAKQCILLIFVGTYFWSGIHKFNTTFFEIWGRGLGKRIPFVPQWTRQAFTYAVPILEASFGVFLVFTKTRKFGIWLICIMHAMILTTFLIGNFGYAVFPLTMFNVFTLFYVFYRKPFSNKELFKLNSPKPIGFFLLAIVFPAFNFFGCYDHILAFSYFSAKPKYCRVVFLDDEDLKKLPSTIKENIVEFQGRNYLDLNSWSARTIKVMVYPEERVYLKIQKYLNAYLGNPNTKLEYY